MPTRVASVSPSGCSRSCRTSSDAASRRSTRDRKSTRLNSSHSQISYAVFCLKKKTTYVNVIVKCVLKLEASLGSLLLACSSRQSSLGASDGRRIRWYSHIYRQLEHADRPV